MRSLVFLTSLAAFVASAASEVKLSLIEDFDAIVVSDDGTHYGNPNVGCQDDESAFEISGIPGKICAPKCTDFLPCPTDVPSGVTAQPTCALKSPSGDSYCALVCSPAADGGVGVDDDQCGDATCQPISNVGICTYGDESE